MSSLYKRLLELSQSDIYPFHMPGHKRNMQGRLNESLYNIDITEIDGFDNLHHAEGILKELKVRVGKIYGGHKTWISVNGSTAGILSAISAVCNEKDTIILDRGSHKSAYNACALKKLKTVFVYPRTSYDESVIRGGIEASDIESLIDKCNPKAVFITSPTYDGVISDIEAIADACHENGIPLIVDEAHGAHFFLDKRFPQDALSQGADVVIHSIHKTLPAPTQTALVHLQGQLVSSHSIDMYMGMYQTSSPSYVLMAAIEQCFDIIEKEGRGLSDEYFKNLTNFYKKTTGLKNIAVLESDCFRDLSKIIIFPTNKKLTGVDIGKLLRSRYHIEVEMIVPTYVCALSTIMDRADGFERLADALMDIDENLELIDNLDMDCLDQKQSSTFSDAADFFQEQRKQAAGYTMNLDAPKCKITLEKSVGCKCGGFVQLYPPGIPMLIPGDEITERSVRLIEKYRACGLLVEGVDEGEIWILK